MLIIVGGPMFAGKTTWLLQYTKDLAQGSFVVIKPSMDIRYANDECVTHNGERVPAINVDAQNPVFPTLDKKIKTILLDELNFFNTKNLLSAIREQEKQGRTVVGVGLLYDSEKRPFGSTLALSKLADTFVELEARCDNCGLQAQHTYRKIQTDSQVVLGAAELYGACCTECWDTLKAHSLEETPRSTLVKAYSA